MNDLVERLRHAEWLWPASPPEDGTYTEAADELERQAERINKLESALELITRRSGANGTVKAIAAAALGPQQH